MANKYGAEGTLYPKDAETRARVDQRLYFDMGVFYKVCRVTHHVIMSRLDIGIQSREGIT